MEPDTGPSIHGPKNSPNEARHSSIVLSCAGGGGGGAGRQPA